MEINNKKSVFTELDSFCMHSLKTSNFMEVTEWTNTEGVTVTIVDKLGSRNCDFTYGEIDALKKCIEFLNK